MTTPDIYEALNAQQVQINALLVVLKQAIGWIAANQGDNAGATLEYLRRSSVASAANLTLLGSDTALNERNRTRSIQEIENWFQSVRRGLADPIKHTPQ